MIQYDHYSYACQSNEILNGKLFKPSHEAIHLCQNEAFHKGWLHVLVVPHTSIFRFMPLAHYYDVHRELHEHQHRGELVPTRNEIMGKIGASMLLSYSGLVVSYVTRKGLGFVRVLHSRVVVSSCSNIREIAKQSTRSLLFYEKNTIVSCNRAKLVLSSASDQIILNMFKTFIQVVVCSWRSENI